MSKRAQAISVIKGTDGPTSIFIAGKEEKNKNKIRRIKNLYRNWRYHKRRKRAEKQIIPEFHSLEETKQFIQEQYQAKEVDASYPHYEERRKQMKYSLIRQEAPELIGADKPLTPPKKEEYHLYQLDCGENGQIEIEMEDNYEVICISASCNGRRSMKKLQKIEKEIYLYYGVTQEDIKKRTDRYRMLVAQLSQ